MSKEEILNEYFLVETEKTEEIKGWKVIGTVEVHKLSQSVSPLIEFKTSEEGWLCDFRIKLLRCGLVLVSPEYIIDEDDMIMDAIRKIWGEYEEGEQTYEGFLNHQLQGNIIANPYTRTWDANWYDNNTVLCSAATNSNYKIDTH